MRRLPAVADAAVGAHAAHARGRFRAKAILRCNGVMGNWRGGRVMARQGAGAPSASGPGARRAAPGRPVPGRARGRAGAALARRRARGRHAPQGPRPALRARLSPIATVGPAAAAALSRAGAARVVQVAPARLCPPCFLAPRNALLGLLCLDLRVCFPLGLLSSPQSPVAGMRRPMCDAHAGPVVWRCCVGRGRGL